MTNQNERVERVARDPTAKFVRDLATAPPVKELAMVKAAADAAERDVLKRRERVPSPNARRD